MPAVSLAIAKRPGANAVTIGEEILHAVERLEGGVIPDDLVVHVTRDYGETANEKANELLFHLGLATLSIVALVWVAIGWREALVVLIVIPVTILLTLFAARVMGYTLNRVSLFALIFSIGILVDDAIVVIENIARHWGMQDGRSPPHGRDRCGRRGRQPDHRCHPDRGGGPAADAVRLGHDGAVHEPDPRQCLGGDGVFVLRGGDDHALADAEAWQGAWRCRPWERGRRWWHAGPDLSRRRPARSLRRGPGPGCSCWRCWR